MRNVRARSPLLPVAALLLGGALAVLPLAEPSPSGIAALERPSLDDELTRVQLEQELMRAERTARMLDDLQEALADWDRAPRDEGEGAER